MQAQQMELPSAPSSPALPQRLPDAFPVSGAENNGKGATLPQLQPVGDGRQVPLPAASSTGLLSNPAPAMYVGLRIIENKPASQAVQSNHAPAGECLVFDKEPNVPIEPILPAMLKQLPQPREVRPRRQQAETSPLGIPEVDVEPPGPTEVFGHLDSERELQLRLRERDKDRDATRRFDGFPEEPVVSTQPFEGRYWARFHRCIEPNYVSYQRLYFEDLNEDRYGSDLGLLEPFVTAGDFYANLVLAPYRFFSDPCRNWETNAGYCLPGSAVPYILYPLGYSVTGMMGEAATALFLIFLFP